MVGDDGDEGDGDEGRGFVMGSRRLERSSPARNVGGAGHDTLLGVHVLCMYVYSRLSLHLRAEKMAVVATRLASQSPITPLTIPLSSSDAHDFLRPACHLFHPMPTTARTCIVLPEWCFHSPV